MYSCDFVCIHTVCIHSFKKKKKNHTFFSFSYCMYSYCVVWHLFVDSGQVLQLPHLYLLLFCQELTTVTHFCLVLLMTIGVVVRMSILDTKVAGSNLSINMFSP